MELEKLTYDKDIPYGMRLYASLFLLMTYESLRFCDASDVAILWVADTAICGESVNRKDKNGS